MKHKAISFHRAYTEEQLQPYLDNGWIPVMMCAGTEYVSVILKEPLSEEQRDARIKQMASKLFGPPDDECMSDEQVINALEEFATHVVMTGNEGDDAKTWFKKVYRS